MTNELSVQNTDDGFEGYTEETEGGDPHAQKGVLAGTTRVRFTNTAQWLTSDDEPMPDIEYAAAKILRTVVKWGVDSTKGPEETRILKPGEKYPDIAALNDSCPRTEWRTDMNGKLAGPWVAQHIVYLIDLETMGTFSWPTSTSGGAICVSDLVQRTNWMRRYRNEGVFPVVRCRSKHMATKYGGRERPHLEIEKWIELGSGGDTLPAAETPQQQALPAPVVEVNPQPAPQAVEQPVKKKRGRGVKIVTEPSLREELNDEIPI
jgi:hypothetical protein